MSMNREKEMNLLENVDLRDKLVSVLRSQERNFEIETCYELALLYMKPVTPKVALAIQMLQDELREVWCQTDDAIRGV